MWGFIWNLILVTFGTKYRFEYQNIISFLSTQWHSFSGLHTTLFFKWILPEVIKKMFLILVALFGLNSTKVFLAWNLFCSNFWAKYRFDKSIARSTYGKNTKWQNFYMSTIFAYLRNLFSPFFTWKFGNFFEFTFCSQKIL